MLKGVVLVALVLGCCLGCDADPEATSTPTISVTPTPKATPTPAPSATPTGPPCRRRAVLGPATDSYTVSWVIFSGRRDPTWRLTAAQSRELRERIDTIPGAARPLDEMVGMPGEIGYIVKAAASEDRFLAGAGLKEREFWVPYGETGTFLASTMPCSAFG